MFPILNDIIQIEHEKNACEKLLNRKKINSEEGKSVW